MKKYIGIAIAGFFVYSLNVYANSNDDLQTLREQVNKLEKRIAESSITPPPPAQSHESSFNPAMSLILSGTYEQTQHAESPVSGFAMSPHNSGLIPGFSLKESELGISANIDPQYHGVGTFSLDPSGGISVENGYIQSSELGHGLNLKFGRFFSGLGYLNEQHAHNWDFVDQPLVYRVFWDNQSNDDGIQLKWLAPVDMFIEIGGELGRGLNYPGTNRPHKNGVGASVLYAHIGDDLGIEQSWRAGLSIHQTGQLDELSSSVPDAIGTAGGINTLFNGNSLTEGLDIIWKYAPNGNSSSTYLKIQSEYFRRHESGALTYNAQSISPTTDIYSNVQSGIYLQGVYQFRPAWRAGIRYDRLDPGIASTGSFIANKIILNYQFIPTRTTWMLDYNPSEFTRFRLQLAHDNSHQAYQDNQLLLQYVVSMGAHGAHQY